jgi:hypothetical protein
VLICGTLLPQWELKDDLAGLLDSLRFRAETPARRILDRLAKIVTEAAKLKPPGK